VLKFSEGDKRSRIINSLDSLSIKRLKSKDFNRY